MKRLILFSLLSFSAVACFAQVLDSTYIEQVEQLKREVAALKKSVKQLKNRDSNLAAKHKEDIEELSLKISESSTAVSDLGSEIETVRTTLEEHQKNSEDRFAANEKWIRQMILILIIVFGVLFLLLLIFVFINRSKINKAYIKLDAKVDNIKGAIELKINQLQKTHEDDLADIKKKIEEKKG